ncbi:MAG: hypothetical protein WAL83_06170 [Arenicellales bacterium]
MKQVNMRSFSLAGALMAAALLLGGASSAMGGEMANLVFQGDGSFNGAHGGQAIQVAVVEADSGKVVATQSGTVSKTADPSFSFTFSGVLETGKSYDVDYWIDSNFGGGSAGACDPKAHDHQWKVPLGAVTGDVTHTEKHRPAETTDVCDVFSKM